jgi:hypothetical protein
VLQAYNDWHIHEWAGSFPGRFIPLALLPLWDAEKCIAEIRRVSKLGCHAASFAANPCDFGLPSIHDAFWKPVWTACCDEGLVLCIHIGTGGGIPMTSPDMPVDASMAATPMSIVNTAADWLFSQVLRDHADLRLPSRKVASAGFRTSSSVATTRIASIAPGRTRTSERSSRATCSASTC